MFRLLGRSARKKGAVAGLRDTWSRYPADWRSDPDLSLGAEALGDEWGGPAFADHIVDLVSDYVGPGVDVLELGCGGGKFSRRIAPMCRSLVCTDISPTMIGHTRTRLKEERIDGNVSYLLLNGIDFTGVEASSVDFIFSYDVLLHLQRENVFSYLRDARRVLRENGTMMVHQINFASLGGVRHFRHQYWAKAWMRDFEDPGRRGLIYFMSEDELRVLGDEAGLPLDRLVTDHGDFEAVTAGRDLIGFLGKRRRRLEGVLDESVGLVRLEGGATVYAVIDGVRHAFGSAAQFERHGFEWARVRSLGEADLAALTDGEPLEPWE